MLIHVCTTARSYSQISKNLECFLTMKMGEMALALTIDLLFIDISLYIYVCLPINETDAVDAINRTIITYGQVRYQ